jgi:hypothetical protein
MSDAVETGGLHVEQCATFPKFLKFNSEPLLDGWGSIRNIRSTLDAQISDAGWVYFFVAGGIVKTAIAFDRLTALTGALKQLARTVKAQKCNSFEITKVTTKQFSGLFRVSVSAHARHFQEGPVGFGQ